MVEVMTDKGICSFNTPSVYFLISPHKPTLCEKPERGALEKG